MSLPIKKLYLDSRYRRADSESTSNCKFELKQAIHLPLNCIAYIDDIQIPHTWYNVSNTNNKLYMRIADLTNTNTQQATNTSDRIITLASGNYNIAELGQQLLAKLSIAYAGMSITCEGQIRKGTVLITVPNPKRIRIFSDEEIAEELTSIFGGITINRTNPETANDMFGITGNTVHGATYESHFVNLRLIHNIYVTSPNLGSFDTLGPRGEQNIIKKVQESSDWGYLVFDSVVSEHDYIDVSKGFF